MKTQQNIQSVSQKPYSSDPGLKWRYGSCLTRVPLANMEGEGLMTCAATSHQGEIWFVSINQCVL